MPQAVEIIERNALPPVVIPAFVTPEELAAEKQARELAVQQAQTTATQAKTAAATADEKAANAQTIATQAVGSILNNGIGDALQKELVTKMSEALNAEDLDLKRRLAAEEAETAAAKTRLAAAENAIENKVDYPTHNAAMTKINTNFERIMGSETGK